MTEPIYTDPAGDALSVFRDDDCGVWVQTSGSGLLIPDDEVPEFATSFLKALCAAVGLPEPEVVFPVGSTPYDDDWQPYEAGRAVSMQAGGEP